MHGVFLDLEMNQAQNREERIIQIGAVKVDLRTGSGPEFMTYCNPEEPIVPEITALTGITDKMVADAPMRPAAFLSFWDWVASCNVKYTIIAWGQDVEFMVAQSRLMGVEPPPKVRGFNFKEMFRWFRAAQQLPLSGGLRDSLKVSGLDFEGRPHDALDDARNTARLGCHCFAMIRRYHKLLKAMKEPL